MPGSGRKVTDTTVMPAKVRPGPAKPPARFRLKLRFMCGRTMEIMPVRFPVLKLWLPVRVNCVPHAPPMAVTTPVVSGASVMKLTLLRGVPSTVLVFVPKPASP